MARFEMKFSKETFSRLDLPDLPLDIWSYAHGQKTDITLQYAKWCGELAAECWLPKYLDFNFFMRCLLRENKNFYNFGKIPSCDKHLIYEMITK